MSQKGPDLNHPDGNRKEADNRQPGPDRKWPAGPRPPQGRDNPATAARQAPTAEQAQARERARNGAQIRAMDDKAINRLRNSLRRHVKGKPTHIDRRLTPLGVISHGFTSFVKFIAILLVVVIFLSVGVGIGTLFGYIATTEPLPSDYLRAGSQTSYVYDSKGNIMAKLTGEDNVDRVYVSYNDVENTYIDDAFIAIEDERFATNIGIDPKRILSAVISALTNGGEATHGGSTITQQTVKLLTGDDQRSAQRKVQEWYKAIALNNQLTKWEIMELYLNLVPMANSYVGIESAARAYFGKSAAELDLAECAYLAGIPKSPSTYNPLTESGRRNGLRRQRVVLSKMRELGQIDSATYHRALETDLKFNTSATSSSATQINSYFTEYAMRCAVRDLQERNGYSRDVAYKIINGGGVKIYTTMEPDVQNALDDTFRKRELFAAQPSRLLNIPEQPEAGFAIINNSTGGIAGLQGGYGPKTANLVLNRATDIERQPGSVTKPINTYAPALQLYKATGATILDDHQVFMDPGDPSRPYPINAYPGYRGKMTLRNALKISNNVPAAETLQMVGLENSKLFMKAVGIDRMDDPAGIAMAMGGYEKGMSPLEIASAFTVFPNGGRYTAPFAYTRVEDSQGNILLENKTNFQEVYRPSVAFMMTKIMEETVQGRTSNFPYPGSASGFGTIKNQKGATISTSGKTGTSDEDVDKWFAAFTPYYTGAVWYGYDNTIKKQSVIGPDNEAAKKIWFDTMRVVHRDKEAADWTMPGDVVALKICINSGKLATYSCGYGNTMTEYFEKDSPLTPRTACPVHGGYPLTPYGGAGAVPIVTSEPPTQMTTAETTASVEELPRGNNPAGDDPENLTPVPEPQPADLDPVAAPD